MEQITIEPCGPLLARIRPPGSKSITNRALVCAALANGPSELTGALASDDTAVMIEALRKLGGDDFVVADRDVLRVRGGGERFPQAAADLWVGNSGTTIRFLTAMLAVGQGRYRLDGVPRMRQRPIADLIDALRQLGADVVSESNNGCPPVIVNAHGLNGGTAHVRASISSQFLSGLLMAAPYAQHDVELRIDGEMVSQPYVEMTLAVMESFGVAVPREGLDRFHIPAGTKYRGRQYAIEPDASAASYFWGAAAIAGGEVTVQGLTRSSLQGDVAFVDCLEQMGCHVQSAADGITVRGGKLRGIDVNMNAISDTVQTLAVVALFAEGPTTIRDVAHIRHKETDRIGDLARELRKLGATVEETGDGLRIIPNSLRAALIETYEDHRMAMSLALAGLRVPGVTILNPRCTEKTYPHFFDDLATVTTTSSA